MRKEKDAAENELRQATTSASEAESLCRALEKSLEEALDGLEEKTEENEALKICLKEQTQLVKVLGEKFKGLTN
jgi:hypothetical protein